MRALELPADLFEGLSPQVLRAYRQRVAVEEPYELRRHPTPLRMSLLAAFSYLRGRELTDTLVDLLIELIHRIGARAERRVEQELLEDLKRVKAGLAQARAAGRILGRPRSAAKNAAEVRALFAQGLSQSEIARRVGIGRTSVRRLLT